MRYRTDYQTTACPRCGVVGCSSPDEKACSDNCITRLYAKLAESTPLAERVQAALTDDRLIQAWIAGNDAFTSARDGTRVTQPIAAAMRAVLFAALALTPQE